MSKHCSFLDMAGPNSSKFRLLTFTLSPKRMQDETQKEIGKLVIECKCYFINENIFVMQYFLLISLLLIFLQENLSF